MPDLRPDRATLAKFAGLALGIMLGGVLGLIVFGPLGMGPPVAASVRCLAGASVWYLLVSLALLIARHRQDAEIGRAAEAVKAELGLPKTISIKIKNGRAMLEGEVERYSERHEAERAISAGVGPLKHGIAVATGAALARTSGLARAERLIFASCNLPV